MGLFTSIKAMVSGTDVADEAYYEAVAHELADGVVRPGLWAKALADADYDDGRAKARYIRLRVEALKGEVAHLANQEHLQKQAYRQMLAHEDQLLEADALPAFERADYQKAFRGFSSLAEKGQSWAQNYLGIMYENGQGVVQDLNESIYWYKKAAAQNDHNAQFNLGRLCLHCLNDYDSATKWFSLAHKGGHPGAAQMRNLAAELVKARKNF